MLGYHKTKRKEHYFMDNIGIAVGVLGVSLILIFIWMIALSMRKRRLKEEKAAKEIAYHKALQRMREQEHKERLFKAESGHVPTMLYLAKEAERGNSNEAFFWYEKAASMDDRNGIFGLIRLAKRMRTDVIMNEKIHFWETYIRAQDGDLLAKMEVGKLFIEGTGTEVNVQRGLTFMQEAAEKNVIDAILFMADWCVAKDNPSPSPSDSNYWLYQAVTMGNTAAMMKLGLHYLNGIGVSSDHRKACYWLERASERGSREAMFHAGHAWMDYGTNGNEIAYIWFFLSAMCQYEPAKAIRDAVGAKIGVESVVGLQSLAKPLHKKIINKDVSDHALIRVLNRLYKRPIPVSDEDKVEVTFESLSSEHDINAPEQGASLAEPSLDDEQQDAQSPSSTVEKVEESKDVKPSLDFTQKHF